MALRLGVNADNGGAFLNVYGAETGRRWKDFSIIWPASHWIHIPPRAVMAARSTFSGFEQWLDSQEVLL